MDNKLEHYYYKPFVYFPEYDYIRKNLEYITMAIGIRVYDSSELLHLQRYDSDNTYLQELLSLTKEEIDGLKELYTDIDSIIVKKLILLKHEEKIEELVDFLDKEKIEKIRNENIIKVKWE